MVLLAHVIVTSILSVVRWHRLYMRRQRWYHQVSQHHQLLVISVVLMKKMIVNMTQLVLMIIKMDTAPVYHHRYHRHQYHISHPSRHRYQRGIILGPIFLNKQTLSPHCLLYTALQLFHFTKTGQCIATLSPVRSLHMTQIIPML